MGCVLAKEYDVYTKSSLGTLKDVPVVFVSGVPGAGNKTASEYLSTMTGFVSIFPGDLERNLDPSTENDETVAKALKENKILPEEATVERIKKEMLKHEDAKGFIIGGFPRNVKSLKKFEQLVKIPEKVITLQVDNDTAKSRLEKKFGELGKTAHEIKQVEQIVKTASYEMKRVQKNFDEDTVISVDSSCTNLAEWNKSIEYASQSIVDKENDNQQSSDEEVVI